MRRTSTIQAALGIASLLALAMACSSGGGNKSTDAGGADGSTTDDGGDEGSSGSSSGGSGSSSGGDGGVYSSPDAPLYAADGCALLNVTCTGNAVCCSGQCTMGVCTTTVHP